MYGVVFLSYIGKSLRIMQRRLNGLCWLSVIALFKKTYNFTNSWLAKLYHRIEASGFGD
jgi:hypothetical protein